MGDGESSSSSIGLGAITLLLVAILWVLLGQGGDEQDAPDIPQPVEMTSRIDPQVKFRCADLQAQIDIADNRASASSTYEAQSRWLNKADALQTRYNRACDEYDTWLRTR